MRGIPLAIWSIGSETIGEVGNMQQNPRVSLVLLRASWLGCGNVGEMPESVQVDTYEIVEQLEKHFEVLGPWVIDTAQAVQQCREELAGADVDMIILAFQTWSEPTMLVPLLDAVGSRPLVVWCYLPWRRLPRPASQDEVLRGSGPVGTFAALGILRNLEVPFLFTFGAPEDPRLLRDLTVAAKAARVREALRSARFALPPVSNGRDLPAYVDETRLSAELGPTILHIPMAELEQAVGMITDAQVSEYCQLIHQEFPVEGVSDSTLEAGARAALALKRISTQNRLDVLSIRDVADDLHRLFKLRPALYPDLLEPGHTLYQPEADLLAATANYILHQLTGSPTFFLELWFWDEAKNQIIGGHYGLQNPAVGSPKKTWISRDFHYCRLDQNEGAQIQLLAQPGRVTLFQLHSTPGGWQAIAATGVCLEGQPWVDAYPHVILRLDTPIEHFLNRIAQVGASEHWIMAYGSVLHEIEAFCQMEKIELEVMTY
jgi:L-fucose isomerase-like protein